MDIVQVAAWLVIIEVVVLLLACLWNVASSQEPWRPLLYWTLLNMIVVYSVGSVFVLAAIVAFIWPWFADDLPAWMEWFWEFYGPLIRWIHRLFS